MSFNNLETVLIDKPNKRELKKIQDFLKQEGLDLDKNIDYTVVIEEDGEIVGTGSFSKNILKCFAINENYRGLGISNTIVSELISEEYRRENSRLFVFTKPKNEMLFKNLGFYPLEKSEKVLLLENDKYGIERYCNELIDESLEFDINSRNYKNISSIVMNCNPFTLGHRYLVEEASKGSDIVHLFIVDEDESIFPTEVRYNLVCEGIKDLKNVIIHKGVDYIISNSTFPTYFLKTENDVVESQAVLDVKIFAKHIAKFLGINKRYVGTEPYCNVTSIYNKVLSEILPQNNVELIEIERKSIDGQVISASKVRALIKEDKLEEAKKFIPKTTYNFLISDKGKEIIEKIKNN